MAAFILAVCVEFPFASLEKLVMQAKWIGLLCIILANTDAHLAGPICVKAESSSARKLYVWLFCRLSADHAKKYICLLNTSIISLF